jgi:hypothetical protein
MLEGVFDTRRSRGTVANAKGEDSWLQVVASKESFPELPFVLLLLRGLSYIVLIGTLLPQGTAAL